jgi:K+-sensing histidine kinase KdpD
MALNGAVSSSPELLLASAARAVRTAADFEGLVRPLLDALQAASGYESTYFTLIHWDDDEQEVKYVLNRGDLDLPEGLRVEWSDTLCRRALMGGPPVVEDAGVTYPDSEAARALGLKGYASAPVTMADGTTVGTLCGASTAVVADDPATRDLFAMFSLLIGQALAREQLLAHERERTHEAEERLRNRLESVAAAEHMLKTPLTVLSGWAKMFSRKGDALSDEQRAEGYQAIERSAATMRELVDRLLASTRDDFRLSENLHLQVIDVAPVLRRLVTAHQAHAAEQTWSSQIDTALIGRIDVASFEQLVSHVLDNAIKYAGPGAQVDIAASTDESGALTVTVADTGPGMPADLELFQPFSRSKAGERADSVGIGLHVVKALATAHGATVEYRGVEPHGTAVEFVFPGP